MGVSVVINLILKASLKMDKSKISLVTMFLISVGVIGR